MASLVAVFGEFDISGDLEKKRSVTKNVKRVVAHREYDAATFENDLALLELESPIHYDTHIGKSDWRLQLFIDHLRFIFLNNRFISFNYLQFTVPICMPNDGADFTGRMATVTGWGRLKYGGGVPSVLQEVQVIFTIETMCCGRHLIRFVFQVPVIENTVCQEMFHTAGHNKKILPSFLCAGYANGQKDSCEVSGINDSDIGDGFFVSSSKFN